MTTLRGVLSAVAAIFVALLAGLVSALWPINNSKATGLGSGRRGLSGKPFLSFVLDSRCLVFCFVLRGKSAQQQAAKNPSILDSSYRYFDTRTGHLLPIHIRMDTFQKRVIDVINYTQNRVNALFCDCERSTLRFFAPSSTSPQVIQDPD